MTNIDDKILETLCEEDRELLSTYSEDMNKCRLITESFRGKQKFYIMLVWADILFFTLLLIFSVYQYFTTEAIAEKLTWMGGFVLSVLAISLMKMWYWMELNKLAVTRDIKRVELQISLLAQKLDTK
ncbi:hypothetical protein KO528_15580 [Saccharophagus degradans]|uniref:Uncharacterized protein n=1 Tax=Saccharophagus degradans TaxID=86304 RepID=A0AAW7X7M1_9GAMM|nr:DUF6768 family protein [Saccharophagus degradans]MBU2986785.1 hypothetical protein [Saccharophagus degradans]MDO6422783.1 hypothetical protein [Saccharophagus degradans]MDO6606256.1 hypothetical protein [Saccharophagus degradans]WGO98463.1 hypothetical protein QFX18_00095 [Saccharophagus degradans]